ncbi:hypothetical protein NKI36_16730 [Mesorhizobium caraganae]|uniref:Secreted protein n=1 Tax=Mesorhizobium caraganae TaxID=483206 RepID=A0ABV1Z111_9HYPH
MMVRKKAAMRLLTATVALCVGSFRGLFHARASRRHACTFRAFHSCRLHPAGEGAGWSLKNTVYCADDRIEVSFWDLEQMKMRRGSDVCQFQSYTSYSSALNFAQKNFGGEGRVVVAEAVQTQASCRSDRYRLRDFLRCWSDEPSHSTRADARSSK